MTGFIHKDGKEFERRLIKGDVTSPGQVTLGVFDDRVDGVVEADSIGDITSEPGSQPRATIDLSNATFSFEGDEAVLELPSTTLDVSGTSAEVDSFFLLVNYDGSDQLYATGSVVENISDDFVNLGGGATDFEIQTPTVRQT